MVNVRLSGPCWQWKEAALAAIRGCLMIMSHYFGVVLVVGGVNGKCQVVRAMLAMEGSTIS